MQMRRVAPVIFALVCLGLSALVLRRQFAAHPAPPRDPSLHSDLAGDGPGPGPVWDTRQPASPAARRAVTAAIGSQLAAIRAGDADRAWFYQSRGLRSNFASPQAFQQEISRHFPEFGHARAAEFGPVWTDKTERYAGVMVTVRGENGGRARGYYRLVREEGGYKVAGVRGGGPITE